jgi:hypothetical protein
MNPPATRIIHSHQLGGLRAAEPSLDGWFRIRTRLLNGEQQDEIAENRCCYRSNDPESLVRTDLDDLVTALYVTIDEPSADRRSVL